MRRARVTASALAAATLLSACGEPRTAAEYERLVRAHVVVGAVVGLVLYGVVQAAFAWRHRRRQWLALGPESPAAGLAAFGSMSVVAMLSGVAGATVASLAVPVNPATVDASDPDGLAPVYAVAILVVALVALPLLASVGTLFADFAEYPPRGAGAPAAALLHGAVALLALRLGATDPSAEEAAFRLLLALPSLTAVAAYAVLHARWWRSRRIEC